MIDWDMITVLVITQIVTVVTTYFINRLLIKNVDRALDALKAKAISKVKNNGNENNAAVSS